MNPFNKFFYAVDIVAFARDLLDFPLDPHQAAILGANPRQCLLNCTRQWGKSTITAIKALHNALFNAGSLTLVLSPSERQSAEFIHKVQQLVLKTGHKLRGDGKNGSSILLPNKSRIIGLPSKESTIRGFSSVSLLLIDEASRVPDELYQSVRPMLAVSGGSLWLISTPFGRRGFFYQAWNSSDSEWARLSVTAYQCPRIKAPFLESERKALGELFFRQEYLCEFHDQGGQLIPHGAIDRSLSDDIEPLPFAPPDPPAPFPLESEFDPAPKPPTPGWPDYNDITKFYVGIDFGKRTDHTAVAILEKSRWFTGSPSTWDYKRNSETRYAIRHLERFPLNTMYTDIAARIGRLVNSFDSTADLCLIADATGVGDAAVELIRNLRLGRALFPVIITAGDQSSVQGSYYHVPKRDLLMKLVIQFESRNIRVASKLPLAATLREELAGLGVRFSAAGNDLISGWRQDLHDDLVFAVALANWRAQADKWREPGGRLL